MYSLAYDDNIKIYYAKSFKDLEDLVNKLDKEYDKPVRYQYSSNNDLNLYVLTNTAKVEQKWHGVPLDVNDELLLLPYYSYGLDISRKAENKLREEEYL